MGTRGSPHKASYLASWEGGESRMGEGMVSIKSLRPIVASSCSNPLLIGFPRNYGQSESWRRQVWVEWTTGVEHGSEWFKRWTIVDAVGALLEFPSPGWCSCPPAAVGVGSLETCPQLNRSLLPHLGSCNTPLSPFPSPLRGNDWLTGGTKCQTSCLQGNELCCAICAPSSWWDHANLLSSWDLILV